MFKQIWFGTHKHFLYEIHIHTLPYAASKGEHRYIKPQTQLSGWRTEIDFCIQVGTLSLMSFEKRIDEKILYMDEELFWNAGSPLLRRLPGGMWKRKSICGHNVTLTVVLVSAKYSASILLKRAFVSSSNSWIFSVCFFWRLNLSFSISATALWSYKDKHSPQG